MHRGGIGIGPAAARGRIAQERDVMAAARGIDRGRKAGLFGDQTGDGEAAGLRHHAVEQMIAVAGRLLALEHHVRPPRLETGNPCRRLVAAFEDTRAIAEARERDRDGELARMPDRGHAIVQQPLHVRRIVLCQRGVVFFLQIDHDQQAAARCSDIGAQIDDRAHRISADSQIPLLIDFSRMPGLSQRPSGRMST